MSDLLLCDIPESVVDALEQRAAHHGRTLQEELRIILALAALQPEGISPAEEIAQVQHYFEKRGRNLEDSTPLLREDRAR